MSSEANMLKPQYQYPSACKNTDSVAAGYAVCRWSELIGYRTSILSVVIEICFDSIALIIAIMLSARAAKL